MSCLVISYFLYKKNVQFKQLTDKLIQVEEEAEQQKFELAEASVNMLEKSEELEQEKYKLAEANLNILELNHLSNLQI